MASDCLAPSNEPSWDEVLALMMALRTSSTPMPMAAMRAGSMVTRIAGCSAPLMVTCATPRTCEMRWAISVSATSNT